MLALGWLSSLLLVFTIGRQVWKQWAERATEGISTWLFIGQTLASTGFTVYTGADCRVAYAGEEGFQRVVEFRPHVVFLDIGMPDLDGYETCRRIRESTPTDEVFIVALTGWGQERDKANATRAGFDAHLTKPADPAVVLHLLCERMALVSERGGAAACDARSPVS